jgi:hypothetical protein
MPTSQTAHSNLHWQTNQQHRAEQTWLLADLQPKDQAASPQQTIQSENKSKKSYKKSAETPASLAIIVKHVD